MVGTHSRGRRGATTAAELIERLTGPGLTCGGDACATRVFTVED